MAKQNTIVKHTFGMFIVGAIVWILYLVYANILTIHFGINHFVAEISGIPLSWVINYAVNTKFNFDLPFTWKRFGVFCLISAGGWVFYELTTWLCTDVLKWYSMIGTILGVGTKTVMNVVLQQAITFGMMARKKEPIKAKATYPDYDWNAYYFGNPIQKYWKKKIVDYTLGMVGQSPILDVGCGSSPLLMMINAKGKFGIDVNQDKINYISSKDLTSEYRICNGVIPFDAQFGTVICNEVIEHHPRPNNLVAEISRVTKPNGTVIISTPDFSSIKWNIIEVVYGLLMHSGYELEHGSKFTETGIVALCNAYGLEIEKVERVAGCDMVCQFRKVN